jgi:hypothetical protein
MPFEGWTRMKNTPGLLQSCPLLHVEGARLHLLHAITDGYCLSYRLTDQFALERKGGGREGAEGLDNRYMYMAIGTVYCTGHHKRSARAALHRHRVPIRCEMNYGKRWSSAMVPPF